MSHYNSHCQTSLHGCSTQPLIHGSAGVGSVHGLRAQCWVQWKHHGSIRSIVEIVAVLYVVVVIVWCSLEM